MALISKKKLPFKINLQLRKYLIKYGREIAMPLQYSDLLRFENAISLYDKFGNDTLWQTVFYPHNDIDFVYEGLKKSMLIYVLMVTKKLLITSMSIGLIYVLMATHSHFAFELSIK
jgi:hypothetical protein